MTPGRNHTPHLLHTKHMRIDGGDSLVFTLFSGVGRVLHANNFSFKTLPIFCICVGRDDDYGIRNCVQIYRVAAKPSDG